MEALLEKTTKADQKIAKDSVGKLRKAAKSGKSIQISLKSNERSLHIPEKAMKLLIAILSNMADGKDTAVLSAETYLSTQEAADYMKMSRPHIVQILEAGDIPYIKVGSHRRVKFSDLVAFDKKLRREQQKGLKELARLSQEMGLYDE
jgi:excisionase family DNA binding protein